MQQYSTEFFIGVDLGDDWSSFCVLDGEGEVVEEGRVRTQAKQLKTWAARWRGSAVAIEVGTHSPWVSRLLEAEELVVLVANPRRVRLIYAKERKNDRLDAESLARLLRSDRKLLKPIQHRQERTQGELATVRMRAALVRVRTDLINHTRGIVKSLGQRLPSCSSERFGRLGGELSQELRDFLAPVLVSVSAVTHEIQKLERQIEELGQREHPEVKSLRTVDGVGPITALTYVLTLEDPSRFNGGRAVGAYLGLCPRQWQSGKSDPANRISRRGDPYLRQLLVQSAQRILGPFGKDSGLRRWGLVKAAGGGKRGKRRAVVAVARKLAVVLYRLWITEEPYRPFPEQGKAAAGVVSC